MISFSCRFAEQIVIVVLRVCRRGPVGRRLTYRIVLGGRKVKGELHDDGEQKESMQVNDCEREVKRTTRREHGVYKCLFQ
jgi:hypothetical protein